MHLVRAQPGVAGQLADGNASASPAERKASRLSAGPAASVAALPSTGSITDCPPPPAAGTNFVDVSTATQTASGSTLLPPVFATTLLGDSSYQGTAVRACAQAEWGAPSAATADALTISACEWDQATQQGAVYAPAPPYSQSTVPAASFDQVLTLDPGNDTGCATEPAGRTGPRPSAGRETQRATAHCRSADPFPRRTGTSVIASCQAALQNAQQSQIPILVPVYVSLNDGAGTYVLQGFADFVVTGYNLPPGFFAADWLNPADSCQGTDYCLTGYFVQGVIPATGSLGGTYLGSSVIDLTG